MRHRKSYWVVSPNVAGEVKGALADWERIICRKHVAIMGWSPKDHQIGQRFVRDIAPGHIILIARRHNDLPDIVGFGVVRGPAELGRAGGKAKTSIKGMKIPRHFGSLRYLSPFVRYSQTPKQIPFIKVLGHTMALAKLHPNRDQNHKRVCNWMEQQLVNMGKRGSESLTYRETETRQNIGEEVRLVGIPKDHHFDYKFRSQKQVIRARKREAELLGAYRSWMQEKYGHAPCAIGAGKLICDFYEKERRILIEAKSSNSRENMRMAVGQLLDYSFFAREKFGKSNMGILLPEKPSQKSIAWLRPLKIGVVWPKRGVFKSYPNGKFT